MHDIMIAIELRTSIGDADHVGSINYKWQHQNVHLYLSIYSGVL